MPIIGGVASIGDAYTMHHARLLRELERIVPPLEAEEVAAATWAIAVRREIRGDVWSYVWTVARRLAWRHRQRVQEVPLSAARNYAVPVDELEARAAWIDTMRGAAELPERQRVLLGLSAADVPREAFVGITGDTPKTVDRQLGRARRRLRGATHN